MNYRLSSLLFLLVFSSVLMAQDNTNIAGKRTPVELKHSRHISSADGLPSNQIFDMTQDADGYIWIAASNGLSRYDGYHFYNIYELGPEQDPIQGAVGYVFPDDDKRHLWMRTSTYVFCCYDLRTGMFIDFTGHNDYARTYRRYIRGKQGVLWMFDDESGVRRVKGNTDGDVYCTDYNKENGNLPENHVSDAFEDDQGRLWAITTNGISIIDTEGNACTIGKGIHFLRGIQIGSQILTLARSGEIITFDANGRELRRTPKAEGMKDFSMVTASFEWHGVWMIFTTGQTFMVSPKDGKTTITEQYHIRGGAMIEGLSYDNNHFISNSTGILYVFPEEGDMRVLKLLEGVDTTVERFRRYNIKKASDGMYYIASYGNGLFVYDLQRDHLQHYSATSPWAIVGNNYLNNILIDRSGCIWLSEESTGLTCILPPDNANAEYFYPQPEKKGDWSNFIRMVHYTGNEVFVSTRDNRLYELQPGAQSWGQAPGAKPSEPVPMTTLARQEQDIRQTVLSLIFGCPKWRIRLARISDVEWQVVMFWWSSMMQYLKEQYPKCFKSSDKKPRSRSKQQPLPIELYTRSMATLQKYLGGLTETEINAQTAHAILRHLNDMAVEAEEMEKIRKKHK